MEIRNTGKGTIYQYPNYVSIDLKNIQSVLSLNINYKGAVLGESSLPEDWQLFANDSRIICISSKKTIPDIVFLYTGKLTILGATVITGDLERVPLSVSVEGVEHWSLVRRDWNDNAFLNKKHYSDYDGDLNRIKFVKTDIRRNNLYSDGNLFLSNGAEYVGDYHQHQNGAIMSGKKHYNLSLDLYRRDVDGNLYNPLKGAKQDPRDRKDRYDKRKTTHQELRKEFALFKGRVAPDDRVPNKKTRGGGGSGRGSSHTE